MPLGLFKLRVVPSARRARHKPKEQAEVCKSREESAVSAERAGTLGQFGTRVKEGGRAWLENEYYS